MNIQEVWQSEETLEAAYKELLSLSGLDRTKDASKLVQKLMTKLVNSHPTAYDIREWVRANVKDFNIASQILLNCQAGPLPVFKLAELKTQVDTWASTLGESPDGPFAKKAKFREGDDDATKQHNLVLAGARNLKILSELRGMNSFRITPISSTPALADLNNLSSISIQGLAPFTHSEVWLLNHKAIEQAINLRQQDDGAYAAEGLIWPIYSKSGGDTVVRAITSRWFAYQLMMTGLPIHVTPKYDSVLVSGGTVPDTLKEYVVEFKG